MSLILDALRKAEAERQRGHVPGLHGVAAAPPPPARTASRPAALVPAAALLLLAAAAVAVWAWLGRGGPAAPPGPTTAVAPPAVPAAAPVAPVAVTPLPLVVSAPPPAPTTTEAAAPVAPLAPSARAADAPARPAAPATPAPPTAPILTQVRRLAELPAEQRQTLPPLVVGGSVWSEQASARFVVLDGQVLREGDTVAPGLVLLKLAPRAATLRWRDSLIEVPF